jgi:hypothetical protein
MAADGVGCVLEPGSKLLAMPLRYRVRTDASQRVFGLLVTIPKHSDTNVQSLFPSHHCQMIECARHRIPMHIG